MSEYQFHELPLHAEQLIDTARALVADDERTLDGTSFVAALPAAGIKVELGPKK